MRTVAVIGEVEAGMVARCCCMASDGFNVSIVCGFECFLRLEGSEVSLVKVQWSEGLK